MKKPLLLSVLLAVALTSLFSSGCMMPEAACAEDRAVQSAADTSKTVTVTDGMVFGNAMMTRGIRFPGGVYVLEAEDADYRYFRAPAPLEYRVLRGGQPVDGQDIPGGLMLAKSFNLVPGAAYMDGDAPGKKIKTWKLGGEFLRVEGRSWKCSFRWR